MAGFAVTAEALVAWQPSAKRLRHGPSGKALQFPRHLSRQSRAPQKNKPDNEPRLVALAERGVRAEAEARQQLKASYNSARYLGPARLPKIQFANLPRTLWPHLLQRVKERRISVAGLKE
jgi:hypothetical protein